MRRLSHEMTEIANGSFDEKLLQGYELAEADPEQPLRSRYRHRNAAAETSSPAGHDAGPGPPQLQDKKDDANFKKQQQQQGKGRKQADREAHQAGARDESRRESGVRTPTGLAEIAEEHEGNDLLHDSASLQQQGREASALVGGENANLKGASKAGSSSAPAKAGKPALVERRSSSRAANHRTSIGGLTPIASIHEGLNESADSGARRSPVTLEGDEQERSPKSAAMDRDESSREGDQTLKTSRRGARKSSVPRDQHQKRKRTATPQRGASPTLSDSSRSKRVKTEEPESSVGTPGEYEVPRVHVLHILDASWGTRLTLTPRGFSP